MRRAWLIAAFAAGAALAVHAQTRDDPTAYAQASAAPAIEADAMADQDLDQYRGGFLVGDGQSIGFGAVTRTFIDGQLALETQLTWGGGGALTQSTGSALASGALDPAALSALSAAGIRLGDLGPNAFVSADGGSVVIQHLGASMLTNLVVNAASNRTIVQNTDITLTLPGFQDTQAALNQSRTAASLSQAAANAAVSAIRH